jgi:hypothetical protein
MHTERQAENAEQRLPGILAGFYQITEDCLTLIAFQQLSRGLH